MNIKTYFPGMGEAVADRTVNRRIFTQAQKAKLPHTILINPKDDLHDVWRNAAELSCWPFRITSDAPFQSQEPETRIEGWADVAERVAEGNAGLVHGEEYDATELFSHIARGNVLMSGRHLQHTDRNLKNRNLEVVTNCSTSVLSVVLFYLLLNGSGVGRSYDDEVMLIDWCLKMPHVKIAISDDYPDRKKTKVDWCDKAQAMIETPLVGAHIKNLHETYLEIPVTAKVNVYKVADSRGGWGKAVEQVERMAYEGRTNEYLILEFSDVRPNGQPIRGMQNRPASGPGPLMDALYSIAQIKYKRMPAWEATMHVDHFLAQCVLVGGARRAARMATKHWKDSTIFGFIDFKERNNYWTSNNSVAIDDEFRERSTKMIGVLKSRYDEFDEMSPDELIGAAAEMLLVTDTLDDWDFHAFRVLVEISDSLYHNGKGEPGIINQDKLKVDDSGIEDYIDGMFADSKDFSLDPTTMALTRALARVMITMRYSMIVNPCGEIALLMLGAYCVDGNTRILHRKGYDKIQDLVGQEVEVFNGVEWSKVSPIKTGINQELLKVTLSDGSTLDCTPYHKFSIRGCRQGEKWNEVKAKDLKIGAILPTFRVPFDIEGANETDAYTYGAFLGDGSIEVRGDSGKERFTIPLYEGKHHLPVTGTRGTEQNNTGIVVTVSHLDHEKLRSLKKGELPEWIFSLNRESALNFVRGWLDTDGCYHKGVGGVSISTSEKNRARDLQLLLRRLGFSFVTNRKVASSGDVSNFGQRTSDLWVVYVPASEASMLNAHRVATDYPLDLEKNVKQARVISVEKIEGLHDTFCFNEPKRHMGVFGNMLTFQCVIADVVPFHADTDDDAEAAFRAAVRALIRTNTMDSLYSREVKRTNRIGVGLTGFHEWAYARFGFTWHDLVDETKSIALWRLMSRFRRAVTDEARSYSAKLGVVQPHTDTTFKPAGTTSKLFGLSEGAHLPSMRWYMRWVQFRQDDPLIADYATRGYPTRALRDYPGTIIVGFPTAPSICELDGGDWVVTAAEASPEDQYEFIRLLEKYWLHGVDENDQMLAENFGNQISYTLKYDPSKVSFNEFFSTLIDGQFSIKCCSVMPQTDASGYEYQPEEPITREVYLYHMAQITSGQEDIGLEHLDCANGACPVDFGARA